jgi:V/A-type H+-transporting ATPase subunit A
VDCATPLERQRAAFDLAHRLVTRTWTFQDKEAARAYFTRLTGLFKNLNYAPEDSPDHAEYLRQIEALPG